MPSDPSRLIAALARDRINLDLKTLDLCFLAGLYLQADRVSLASFEEDELIDMFEQICDVVDPGAERPRKRATHAIQRLRDQRMLARVDGAGIVRSGEYTLTRLAAAVVPLRPSGFAGTVFPFGFALARQGEVPALCAGTKTGGGGDSHIF